MEGFSNAFAALNFGDDVSDSEISIPSPPPSPTKKGKPAKVQAQTPSVEDVPVKPKAQARPSSRKVDRAYGSFAGPKVWQQKGDSTPSDGQLVKGSGHNNGRAQQQPRGDYQQANNGHVYQERQRPQGNNQNTVRDNSRVYRPRGDNQNANGYQQKRYNGSGYQQRNNGSGYQQRNGAQEREKTEKMTVDKDGWTHVKPKKGSDGDLSRSSSRPESREYRPDESANADSKDGAEVVKEVSAPADAATEALTVDPKKRKEDREEKKLKEEEEKKREEEEKQRELEEKQITLKEYEQRLMEQRKALAANKSGQERRVVVDKDLQKVLVGKKKQEETLKLDVLGREVAVSEEEEKPEKAEKKKAEKEEDPEKAELVRKLTLNLRFARPPVQRQEGRGGFRRQEGRGEVQQQGSQGASGEVQQQGGQGGRGGYRQQQVGRGGFRQPNVSRQAKAPETDDLKQFPDLSAAKKAGPQN